MRRDPPGLVRLRLRLRLQAQRSTALALPRHPLEQERFGLRERPQQSNAAAVKNLHVANVLPDLVLMMVESMSKPTTSALPAPGTCLTRSGAMPCGASEG